MIKAVGEMGGRPLLVLGLSGENMTRLMAREPILVECASLGLADLRIVLVGGRTEDDIARELAEHGLPGGG